MKAKDIANTLGGLVATTNKMAGNYNTDDIDTDLPEELQEPDPIFLVEHEMVMSDNEKKALKSIQQIVNTIVPKYYQTNPIIKDKMLQDASQLGQLYYQQSMNNVMIKAIMDTIAKGSIEAKMFDSYTKLMSIAKDFNKQINEMQNQFRKYYIDTYLDLQHKEDEDLVLAGQTEEGQSALTTTKKTATLSNDPELSGNLELRETSTKDSCLKIQEWKKEEFRKKHLAETSV